MEPKTNLDRRTNKPCSACEMRRWVDKKHKPVNRVNMLIITVIASIISAGLGYEIGILLK